MALLTILNLVKKNQLRLQLQLQLLLQLLILQSKSLRNLKKSLNPSLL